ncbi:methyl-accepting chemotaxis protein [bacterium]|jgi:methyl-accepting chemotaxis protein|nr:methyl-accepting chemotaxis protein [bacterium]MBT3580940.1 methyl-accepting chemotaxis protein [bacterium]MBT4552023.1 methyl-accepting chemotaxis protein [bacterium]MBT5988251.1 methyl-accepting chemotaxis protein [bacterium]MBT7088593.1 methyl-accepting chemotaxis protein [bacterium]
MPKQIKRVIPEHIEKVIPILQKYALGDFSENIKIPAKEDEYTELLVGIHIMVDDIKELIQNQKDTTVSLTTRVNKTIDILEQVAKSEYSVQIKISEQNDEFDSLSRGINGMIDEIKNRIEKEASLNEELQSSNEELKVTNEELNEAKLSLQDKITELEKQQGFMLDREKRIIEVKREVNSLLKELNRSEKYLKGV